MKCLLALCFTCWIAAAQNGANVPKPADSTPPPVVKPEDKCQVEGTVVNSMTGVPLKKAHLSLRPISQQGATPYGTFTDTAGGFLLDDIDPGRYSFNADHNGFVTGFYSSQGSGNAATLTLEAGQKMKGVIFKLSPQGVIAGRITDDDGEPVPNVMVQSMQSGYLRGKKQLRPSGGATTNDLGEYRIHSLAPGKYYISATYQNQNMNPSIPAERITGTARAQQVAEEGYATTFYPNTLLADSAAPIEIGAGTQAQGIDLRLIRTRTVRISGRIVNLPSGANANTSVQLVARASTWMGSRNFSRGIGHDGTFELRYVSPGSYILMADHISDGKRLSARVPIEAGDSNLSKIELTLLPGSEIAGRFVMEGNADSSTPRFAITLQSADVFMMGSVGTQVKDDLSFKLSNVTPLAYTVNVGGLPQGYYLKSVRIGDQDVTDKDLDFTQAIPAGEMVVTLSSNGGQIDGTVQNQNSEAAIGAFVTLVPESSRRGLNYLYKTTVADQSGHFTLKGIKPGEYKVFAWEKIEPGSYQDPNFLKPLESKGESVSVKENAHESVQVKLIPAESGAGDKNAKD
jgi:hypothetical protein